MPIPRPDPSPTKAEAKDPLPGTVVNGKFRVHEVMAHGGMGKIYRAEQVPLGRPVALKVLRTKYADEISDDPHFHKRFFLEASILSKLQHANIVTLYDYGRIEDVAGEQYFMAMEFLRGVTLSRRIRDVGALAPADALRIARQIAKGLREAHKLGIVHRDLKPSNIMLVPEEDGAEVVKILDFGIGKVLASDASEELTAEGSFVGSPRYMAPEQIREGKVDVRSDVYSLGVMMYECFTGIVPFDGETNIGIMMAHCNDHVPPMRERSPSVVVPEIVERFVRQCLEKDPALRPQTMEELTRALRSCEAELFGGSLGTLSAPVLGVGDASSGKLGGHPATMRSGEVPTVTGVAPASTRRPSDASNPSYPSASGPLGTSPTGTHKSLTRSWLPSSAPSTSQPRRARWLGIGLGAVALLALGIGIAMLALRKNGNDAASASSSTAPPRGSFTLIVESSPEGAEVTEDDRVLGTTPLHMPIDRASVKGTPRKLVVRLSDYAPYTLLQSDSDSDVRVIAQLVPAMSPQQTAALTDAAATPSASASAMNKRGGKPPVATSATATARPPNPDLDIKLKR